MKQFNVSKQSPADAMNWHKYVATFDTTQYCMFLSKRDHSDDPCHHKVIVEQVTLYPHVNLEDTAYTVPKEKAPLTVQVEGMMVPTHDSDRQRVRIALAEQYYALAHPGKTAKLAAEKKLHEDRARAAAAVAVAASKSTGSSQADLHSVGSAGMSASTANARSAYDAQNAPAAAVDPMDFGSERAPGTTAIAGESASAMGLHTGPDDGVSVALSAPSEDVPCEVASSGYDDGGSVAISASGAQRPHPAAWTQPQDGASVAALAPSIDTAGDAAPAPSQDGASVAIEAPAGTEPHPRATPVAGGKPPAAPPATHATGHHGSHSAAHHHREEMSVDSDRGVVPALSATEGPVGDQGKTIGKPIKWRLVVPTLSDLQRFVAAMRSLRRSAAVTGAMVSMTNANMTDALTSVEDAGEYAYATDVQSPGPSDMRAADVIPRIIGDVAAVQRAATREAAATR